MTRQELFTWIRQQYGTEPEYPWHDWNAVLRHNDNNKWYGVVLEVSADKLGLTEAGIIDVVLRKIIVPGIGNKIPHFQKGKSPKSERDML